MVWTPSSLLAHTFCSANLHVICFVLMVNSDVVGYGILVYRFSWSPVSLRGHVPDIYAVSFLSCSLLCLRASYQVPAPGATVQILRSMCFFPPFMLFLTSLLYAIPLHFLEGRVNLSNEGRPNRARRYVIDLETRQQQQQQQHQWDSISKYTLS